MITKGSREARIRGDGRRSALGRALAGVRFHRARGLAEWRYHGRLVARQLDDAHLVIRADFDYRDSLLRQFPETFSIPARYIKHMLVVADLAGATLVPSRIRSRQRGTFSGAPADSGKAMGEHGQDPGPPACRAGGMSGLSRGSPVMTGASPGVLERAARQVADAIPNPPFRCEMAPAAAQPAQSASRPWTRGGSRVPALVGRCGVRIIRPRGPEAFTFHHKGFVVSVGTRRGVADIAGITTGGRLAHLLKDAIEWEYRKSVRHLRGWDPVAR